MGFLLLLISTSGVLPSQSRTLDIYWIDAEGGASALIVTPSAESLPADTANQTPDDRDAKQIYAAAQMAGVKKIDFLLTMHFRGDQYSALAALAKAQ